MHAIGFKQGPPGWWDAWGAKHMPWLFPPGMIVVADMSNGKRLLEVPFFDYDANYLMSDDGRSLVMSRTESADAAVRDHRAYDVPARPRWGWVVGVPAGLGGAFLSWRRLHRKPAATPTLSR